LIPVSGFSDNLFHLGEYFNGCRTVFSIHAVSLPVQLEKDQLYTLFLGSLEGKREEFFCIRTGIVDFSQQVSI